MILLAAELAAKSAPTMSDIGIYALKLLLSVGFSVLVIYLVIRILKQE